MKVLYNFNLPIDMLLLELACFMTKFTYFSMFNETLLLFWQKNQKCIVKLRIFVETEKKFPKTELKNRETES